MCTSWLVLAYRGAAALNRVQVSLSQPSRLRVYKSVLAKRYFNGGFMAQGARKEEHFLWDYDDQSAWGKAEGCEIATTGKRQSPINIETRVVKVNKELMPLQVEGWQSPCGGVFENTGHSIQFTPSTNSTPTLGTPHGTFAFKQFHFHWGLTSSQGSEHCIDGNSYAAEIHFVHANTNNCEDADDYLAVLGVLCQADSGYSSEGTPWEKIKIPQEPGESIVADDIELLKYLPAELDYYYYKGSLTTPPCSEKVLWYMFGNPLKVPEDFLIKLRQIKGFGGYSLTHTYRQCMPLNDRCIEAYYSS